MESPFDALSKATPQPSPDSGHLISTAHGQDRKHECSPTADIAFYRWAWAHVVGHGLIPLS